MEIKYSKPKKLHNEKSILNVLNLFSFTCSRSTESLMLMISDSRRHIKTKEHFFVVQNEIQLLHRNFMYSVYSNAILAVLSMILSIYFLESMQTIAFLCFVIVITIIEGRKIIQIEDTFSRINLDMRKIFNSLNNGATIKQEENLTLS